MNRILPTDNVKSSQGRIPELDGLRAFSVACVVYYHMAKFAGSLPKGPYWIWRTTDCLGQNGVSAFFIISGFIITTLLLREKEVAGRVSLTAFYIRRFCRIVPPFALYLFTILMIRALDLIFIAPKDILASILFLGDLGIIDRNAWFVTHTWSLSVEEQLYLVFPPLLCLVLAFYSRFATLCTCFIYVLCNASLRISHLLALHYGDAWSRLASLYQFRYIVIGVWFALGGQPILAGLTNTRRVVPSLLAALLIGFRFIPLESHVVSTIIGFVDPVLCGLLVMWFIRNPSRCKVLRLPVVQWLGICSYSIYLWQQLFTAPTSCYHDWDIARSPWAIILIIMCAAFSYYCVEKPFIRLGRFFSGRLRQSPSSLTTEAGQMRLETPPLR